MFLFHLRIAHSSLSGLDSSESVIYHFVIKRGALTVCVVISMYPPMLISVVASVSGLYYLGDSSF